MDNKHTCATNQESSWVDESLIMREDKRKPRHSGVFCVTEIASPCLRAVYFDRKISKPLSLDLLRIFNSGRVFEAWWIDFLDRIKDIFILDVNVPYRHINTFYKIHGRADVILQQRYGNIEVHEIKMIKSFDEWLEEPKPEHVNQLQFYLNILVVKNSSIDYIKKLAFGYGKGIVNKRFCTKRDVRAYIRPLKRSCEQFGALMANITPTKEKCWKCDEYCSYNEECENS